MRRGALAAVLLSTAAVTLFAESVASAADGEPGSGLLPAPPGPPLVDSGPNRLLLGTGLVSFGFAYASSVYAAATSKANADRYLFIPVAGPWITLGRREDCTDESTCPYEDTADFLLAADGIVQATGVILVVVAYVEREIKVAKPAISFEQEHRPAPRQKLAVGPRRTPGGGFSIVAAGTF